MADDEDVEQDVEQGQEEEVEEKEKPDPYAGLMPRQRLLRQYHDIRRKNKKSFRKAKENYEIIAGITAYRDLLDRYQMIFKAIPQADLDELKKVCDAANKKAPKVCPQALKEKKPGSGKYDVVQPAIKNLDDFSNFANLKDEIGKFLNGYPEKLGIKAKVEIGPLKDLLRSTQKISEDYDADPARLIDFIRASVVCSNVRDMVKFLKGFEADPHVELARVKNGFTISAASGGYRDIKLNVLFHNHVCEVQLHHEQFYTLKNTGGHKVYEMTRNFRVQGSVDARDQYTDKSDTMYECLEMLLELAYESEKVRKGDKSAESIRAALDWLEYSNNLERTKAKELAESLRPIIKGLPNDPANSVFKVSSDAAAELWSALYSDEEQTERLKNAISNLQKLFGEHHATVVLYKKYLIDEFIYAEKYDQALVLAEETVKELSSVMGETHIETLKCKLTFCDVLFQSKKYQDCAKIAEDIVTPLIKFALSTQEEEDEDPDEEEQDGDAKDEETKLLQKAHPTDEVATAHQYIGSAELKVGNVDKAIEFLQKALQDYIKINDPDFDPEDYYEDPDENAGEEQAPAQAEEGDGEEEYAEDDDADEYPVNEDIQEICQLLAEAYEKKGNWKLALQAQNHYLFQLRQDEEDEDNPSDEYKAAKVKRDELAKKVG